MAIELSRTVSESRGTIPEGPQAGAAPRASRVSPEPFLTGFVRTPDRLIHAVCGSEVASAEAQSVFAANGYTLTRVSPEELRQAALQGEAPVAALIDLDLPDRAGWSLLEAIASKGEAGPRFPFPVVAISGSAGARVHALRFGTDEVLESPFATTELLLRVRSALARSRRRIEALRGSLQLYPLPALLQGIERRQWTGTILLQTPFGRAGLGLYEGRIVQASAGGTDGREALFDLLDLEEGQFVLDPAVIPVPRPPVVPAVWSLLLDSAQLTFELEQREASLPREGEPVAYAGGAPTLDESLAPLPLDEVAGRLREHGPASLAELRPHFPLSGRRLRLTLALLVEQGVARREGATPLPAASGTMKGAEEKANEEASHDTLVLYSPLVAPRIGALLAALPRHEMVSPPGAARVRLRLPGGGGGAGLRVQLRPLALQSVAEIFHDAARARRVVLWLGGDATAQGVPIRLLRAAARKAEDLVFAADGGGAHPLAAGEGDASPWKLAGSGAEEVALLLAAPSPPGAGGDPS